MAGTRPAIALLANGTYEIAYESSAGYRKTGARSRT